MALTPVEIRHVELRRTWLRGYRRSAVDRLLTEIADSFESVWRERADLADRLDELEAEASKHRELEALLRSTHVSKPPPEARDDTGSGADSLRARSRARSAACRHRVREPRRFDRGRDGRP